MTVYLPSVNETDPKKVIVALQQLGAGRSNAVGTVTLATGSTTTTVSPTQTGLISPNSNVILTAMTAAAAAEIIGTAGQVQVTTQVFTSGTNTYTPTAGMSYCVVECVGGGAGGGTGTGTAAVSAGGGGGGAGSYARKTLTAATVGASQTVTVGAGGASASNGNDTSFGSLCIGKAGTKGTNASSGTIGAGGAGGVAGTGDVTSPGGPGGTGGLAGGTLTVFPISGQGGASFFGGGGSGVGALSGATATGGAATAYGAGGGGGIAELVAGAGAGGAGAGGIVIVTEYIAIAPTGTLYVSTVAKDTFTITHTNSATTGRTFMWCILG